MQFGSLMWISTTFCSLLLPLSLVVATCPSKKYTIVADHTACLGISSQAQGRTRGVSKTDSDAIVSQHNKLRASVKDAADMQLMVWNEELASIAQKWADNCVKKHESTDQRRIFGRYRSGQNLAVGFSNWSAAIQSWFDENKVFTFGNQASNRFLKVGHYTQMVWATSARVGCGFADCSSLGKYFVCNYGEAGNMGDWSTPYKQKVGGQCDSCRGSTCITSGDNKGLCDCKGKVCYNGGTLDLKTCKCTKCPQTFHILKQDCALNCSGTTDHYACGTQPNFKTCTTLSLDYCPHMCDLCPYSGYGYVESSITTPASSAPSLRSWGSIAVYTTVFYFTTFLVAGPLFG